MASISGIANDTVTLGIFVMLIVLGIMVQRWKYPQGGWTRKGAVNNFLVTIGIAIFIAGLSLLWTRAVDRTIERHLPSAMHLQTTVPSVR